MSPFQISDSLTQRNLSTIGFLGDIVSSAMRERTEAMRYAATVESGIASSAREMLQTDIEIHNQKRREEMENERLQLEKDRIKIAKDAEARMLENSKRQDDEIERKKREDEVKSQYKFASLSAKQSLETNAQKIRLLSERRKAIVDANGGNDVSARILSGAWSDGSSKSPFNQTIDQIDKEINKLNVDSLKYAQMSEAYLLASENFNERTASFIQEQAPISLDTDNEGVNLLFPSEKSIPVNNERNPISQPEAKKEEKVPEGPPVPLDAKNAHKIVISSVFNSKGIKPEDYIGILNASRTKASSFLGGNAKVAEVESEFYRQEKDKTITSLMPYLFTLATNEQKARPSEMNSTRSHVSAKIDKLEKIASSLSIEDNAALDLEDISSKMSSYISENPSGTLSSFQESQKTKPTKAEIPLPSTSEGKGAPVAPSGSIIPASGVISAEQRLKAISSVSPEYKKLLDEAISDDDFRSVYKNAGSKMSKDVGFAIPAILQKSNTKTEMREAFRSNPKDFINALEEAIENENENSYKRLQDGGDAKYNQNLEESLYKEKRDFIKRLKQLNGQLDKETEDAIFIRLKRIKESISI